MVRSNTHRLPDFQAVYPTPTEILGINEIADTIREIADQTNLFALNAAIEATRGQLEASVATTREMDRVVAMNAENGTCLNRVGDISGRLSNLSHELQRMIGRFRTE